jgi:ribose transport system substrate-binding protein
MQLNAMNRRMLLKKSAQYGISLPIAAAFLEGCGDSGGSGAKGAKESISVILPTPDNVYNKAWADGAKAAAAAIGIDLKFGYYNNDTNREIASVRSAPTLGVKGIVTETNDAAASPGLMRLCQKQKLYAINAWSNQPWSTPLDIGQYYLTYMESESAPGMEAVASYLFEQMGGKGNILHISGVAGHLASVSRDVGLQNALKKYPGIKLLDRQYGGFSRTIAGPVAQNMLTAHPDVDAIVCQNDDSAIGVMNVLKKKGIKAKVVGVDGIPEMLDAIIAGDAVATMCNSGAWIGGLTLARIYDALNGVELDPLDRMVNFESFVLNTPEAAKAYNAKFSSGKIPYDFRKMSRHLHPDDWDVQAGMVPIRPDKLFPILAPKPAGYELPEAYQKAGDADYERIATLYRDHLKSNPYDEIKQLCDFVPIPPFGKAA